MARLGTDATVFNVVQRTRAYRPQGWGQVQQEQMQQRHAGAAEAQFEATCFDFALISLPKRDYHV